MQNEHNFELLANPEYEGLNWVNVVVLTLFHVGAVAALFMFSWQSFAVAILLYWVGIGLGISMGYHRLHTHRSYKVPMLLEYFFAVCGTLTLEGGPIFWVATHRIHHQKSDQAGRSALAARWRLVGAYGLDAFRRDRSTTTPRLMAKYAPDLAKDPLLRLAEQLSLVPADCAGRSALLPSAAFRCCCGAFAFAWSFGLHATWLVNSATHMWGTRRFETRDDSRNNWWVALITFGEGWHNNHHAHPTSARHGLAWYEFDLSWIQITVLKFLGIAKSIRVAKIDTAELPEREAA